MKKLTRYKIREKGFTLVELAIVFGVIGSIISAIWWAAGNASELQKENNAVSELQTVAQNINNLMMGQSLSTSPACSGSTNITCAMIAAQTIPSSFVDSNNKTADSPWGLGTNANSGFAIWYIAPKTYRLSFYSPTYKGCVALLLQATSCQAGQVGCPTQVWTEGGGQSCLPNQNNCPGAPPPLPATVMGWQSMGATVATTMCGDNALTATGGSVEFDYSL